MAQAAVNTNRGAKSRPRKSTSVAKISKRREREYALGDVSNLPDAEREFLNSCLKNKENFATLPPPKSGDWLSEHKEHNQSVKGWRRRFESTVLNQRCLKTKIYLVPLDREILTAEVTINCKLEKLRFLDLLQEYAQIFFKGFSVHILESLPKTKFTSRINKESGKKQLLISDIYKCLEAKFPRDAFCMVGITMVDLYPNESWNFVFGQAFARTGVGVFSFARYDPKFDDDDDVLGIRVAKQSSQRNQMTNSLILWRSCKVMVHEICHLFCLSHCIYYSCAMNGSNHLEEATKRPMFLCPICLLKLKMSGLDFEMKDRYNEMLHFFQKIEDENFVEAAHWLKRVIQMF